MSASEASHQRPDDGFETIMKDNDDIFQVFSDRLDKASPKLLVFGNLLSLVLRGAVFTWNQFWFDCLIIVRMLLYRYCKPFDRPIPSRRGTASEGRKV